MVFIILTFSTVLAAVWFILLGGVTNEDWKDAAYNKIMDNREQIAKLQIKDARKQENLTRYHGVTLSIVKLFSSGNSEKEITRLENKNKALQRGDLKPLTVFAMPGFVLQRKFEIIGRGALHKRILIQSLELYGKKYAPERAKQLIAKLTSYPIIGIAFSLALSGLCIGGGQISLGLAIMGIGTIIILVLVYAMYDELGDRIKKRRDAISRQFPNVVSKLALLVTSGMIVSRAWKETAESNNLELYLEMQATADELDNLIAPETAYASFIARCNTKETTKLASAILQNMSKGNAEIGRLFRDMAKEAWQERRHTAKRDSEKANSKLMIPTMLLFLAILVIIMVPIAINFGSL